MGANQTKFMNGLQAKFATLCQGAQPPANPDSTAWTWLRQNAGVQPAAVNSWVTQIINGPLVGALPVTFVGVGTNGVGYWNALNATIAALAASPFSGAWNAQKQAAWKWFNDQPVVPAPATGDAPADVIDWVETVLPTSSQVVLVADSFMSEPTAR